MINSNFTSSERGQNITIIDGNSKKNIPVEDIIFVQAEHVYIRIHLSNKRQLLHRNSMQRFLSKLPAERFIQVHRSYIVNGHFIKSWDNEKVYMPGCEVPISRSRRKAIDARLMSA
jgi:DNA-binding LytR/AlgR family response regulator